MQAFKYLAPSGLDEVLDILAAAEDETILLGGGTATTLLMKQDLLAPAAVVGLGRVPELRGITTLAGGGLRLGSTCTVTAVDRSPAVAAAYPVLAYTARQIGNVRVRNVATLGGNLVHADPAQDLPPVLMALGATVELQRRGAARTVAVADLIVDFMATCIEPDEVLVALHLPPPPPGLRATYIKFTPRSRDDYATVGVACALTLDGDRCRTAALVVGGAGPTPLRMSEAEGILLDGPLTRDRIDAAAAAVAGAVEPWDDIRGSAEYKRAMSQVWAARALAALGREAGLDL